MFRPRPIAFTGVRRMFQPSAFKEPVYCIFLVGFVLQWLGYFVVSFFIPTFASVKLGASDDTAFYLVSMMNAGSAFGRVLPSLLAGYITPISILTICGIGSGVMFFAWFSITTIGSFIVFTVFWGFFNGVLVTMPSAVIASLTPDKSAVGSRIGMAWGLGAVAILISAPIGEALTNLTTKSFKGTQAYSGSVMLIGSILLVIPWVLADRERKLAKEADTERASLPKS
jgi:MFS family permease